MGKGTLSDARVLGVIASIFMFSFRPGVEVGLGILGYIFLMLAVECISDAVNDVSIREDALVLGVFGILGSLFNKNPIIMFIFFFVSAVFLLRVFNKIADITSVKYFRTTGILFLIGIVLSAIEIGLFVMFIAIIFMFIAFLKLPKQLPTQIDHQ